MFHYVMKTDGFAELPKELIIEALQSHKAIPTNPLPSEPAPGAAATSGSKSGQTQRFKFHEEIHTEHRRRMPYDRPHGEHRAGGTTARTASQPSHPLPHSTTRENNTRASLNDEEASLPTELELESD